MLPTCKYNDLFLIPHLLRFPSKNVAGTPKKQGTCYTFVMFSCQVEILAAEGSLDELDTTCELLLSDEGHDVCDT